MENNEDDKFVSLLADSTFKYMFKDYRDFFIYKESAFKNA